ncbi:MAG: hypothetical protein U0T31_09530 [Chitinophagales bacterium]|nr:hypothetical protein [Chitinophagales bacterium]
MKKTLFLAVFAFITVVATAKEPSETTTTETETVTTTALNPTANNDEAYYNERRFSAITEAGTVLVYHKAYFNIYQVVGVRVNPYFFIGQGVGIQVSNKNMYQFQATVDLRAYALDKRITPMFTVQAGLNKVGNAPIQSEAKQLNDTQFTTNVGAGILIKAKENASFTINGGYTLFTDFKNSANGGFVKIGYVF